MGTAESSQSPELDGIGGFNAPSSFRRQPPNVARLIHSENSQKMEYEFPISDVNISNLGHYRHHHDSGGTSNQTIISGTKNHHHHLSHQQINYNDNLLSNRKISTNVTSGLWSSFTSCFGCRTRASNSSSMNPLRDKVHAIRIVRASNDLTPAVFDSQYNIITLEQLRECDNNGSGNLSDSSDLTNPDNVQSPHSANGSISSTKNTNNHRMKKKKKKRAATAAYGSKTVASDDDDGYERT